MNCQGYSRWEWSERRWKRSSSGEFDVIFMDWQMPEMDGLEATLAIRKHEAFGVKREAQAENQ